MSLSRHRLRIAVAAATAAGVGITLAVTGPAGSPVAAGKRESQNVQYQERAHPVVGGATSETDEILASIDQQAQARSAPYGSVPAGEYSEALASLRGLSGTAASWREVTNTPYDADDPNYRDPAYSNSSGGAGFVAGRTTGLAAGNGYVFAGGANGGVFRKKLPSGAWAPISDGILSLSTGDLVYDKAADTLWYATGEANTGGTSYTGAGVYRLTGASTGRFSDANRVGGTELESRGINQLKVDRAGGKVYAATTRGLWRHSLTGNEAWQLVFMPNPADDSNIARPYRNIINDVAIQPGTGAVLANAAWRSGDTYNGFYLSPNGAPDSFVKVNPTGAINPANIGNAEFAYSADGSKLYTVVEDPVLLQTSRQSGNSVLYGVFVSNSGSIAGPWSKIADYRKLGNSGSALKTDSAGKGYGPGVQAWYNNFIEVDPANSEHVYLGLEEVFETTNGGSTWTVPGPYWNFGFDCWDISAPGGGCPETTHSDQHSVAIDGGRVYVGNDGGVKSRPVAPAASREDAAGHATDWTNMSKGLRTLQYYSVGVGKDLERGGYAVAGGLQDNGGSLLRGDGKDNEGNTEMVSPFGGDGGDIIVNPADACQILDEYVYLTLWMTKNCGQTKGDVSAVFDVSVPDANPRFTAPFRAVRGSQRWVAGGNSVWIHDKGFTYTPAEAAADPANGWRSVYTHGGGGRMTVGLDAYAPVANDPSKDVVYAAWCGNSNCNSSGFVRGVATNYGGTWHELDMTGLPNRFPNQVTIDPSDPTGSTVFLVFNGFNRRFIEGPGAGTKHVYRGKLDGAGAVTWTDLSKGFPDVPATDVVVVGQKLVVGTDLGVLVADDKDAAADAVSWKRVGGNSGTAGALPLTTAFDLHVAPDGNLYVATHGRGIFSTPLATL